MPIDIDLVNWNKENENSCTVTPHCRRFLKHINDFVNEERVHPAVISNSFNIEKKEESTMEEESELLALCSWWSDSEDCYGGVSSDEEDEDMFLISSEENRPQRQPLTSVSTNDEDMSSRDAFDNEDDDDVLATSNKATFSASIEALRRLPTEFDLEASF